MADVRSLLKHEKAARRVQHRYATYSTTDSLVCTVCNHQIQSESLWDGHLRSAGHIMKASGMKEQQTSPSIPIPNAELNANETNVKKRKASEEVPLDTIRKRRTAPELPNGFFDLGIQSALIETDSNASSTKIDGPLPSRPATPSKPVEEAQSRLKDEPSKQVHIDEDEWAAFEADVAALEGPAATEAVITAPSMTAAELGIRSLEESDAKRKKRQEVDLEGDKEDAARNLEMELEEMEGLEQRVRRLREKREMLRSKSRAHQMPPAAISPIDSGVIDAEHNEDEEEDDDDDGWADFRLRG